MCDIHCSNTIWFARYIIGIRNLYKKIKPIKYVYRSHNILYIILY